MLLMVAYLMWLVNHGESTCSHVPPAFDDINYNAHVSQSQRRSRRSNDVSQLKILPYYDDSFESQPNAQELKVNIVEVAISYWERILKVKGPAGVIRLQRKCQDSSIRRRIVNGLVETYCAAGCAPTSTCGSSTIPDAHLDVCFESPDSSTFVTSGTAGIGVNQPYNYILYISAQYEATRCSSGSTLGYASHCQQENAFNRPVAGYINLCPGRLSVDFGLYTQSLFTAKHEILHALGFSVSLYAWFRDANGLPRTPRDDSNFPNLGFYDDTYKIFQWSSDTIRTLERPWTSARGTFFRNVSYLVTPRVVEETRKHFNCINAIGAELENQGAVGVRVTHWEKRLFENELMTPTFTQTDSVSRITLAFLEDSGWYIPDYTKSDNFLWGRNLGCAFLEMSCYEWINSRKSRSLSLLPYCDVVAQNQNVFLTDCSLDRSSMTFCNLQVYQKQLDVQYQYFETLPQVEAQNAAFYGGSVELADYCPFLQEFNWKSKDQKVVRTSSCTLSANNYDAETNRLLQLYGAQSTCINQPDMWQLKQCGGSQFANVSTYGSGCYKYKCDSSLGLTIFVDERAYSCLQEGVIYRFDEGSKFYVHRGSLRCPACQQICGSQCPNDVQLANLLSDKATTLSSYDPRDTARCGGGVRLRSFEPPHCLLATLLAAIFSRPAVH